MTQRKKTIKMVRLVPKVSKPQRKPTYLDIGKVDWLINNDINLIDNDGKLKFSRKNNGGNETSN